jgi:hypothetical protein
VSDLDVVWTECKGLHELASRVDAPSGPGHVNSRWRRELKGPKWVSDLDVVWTECKGLHELASRVDMPSGPGHVQ